MQIGLSYIIEGKMMVAVTLLDTKGQMMSEGVSSDMARHYAEMMLKCADKVDRINAEDKE